jgi:outer membrane protein OmpU
MKKVLFATTALIATAGVAAADVSLSGAANATLIDKGTAGSDTYLQTAVELDIKFSGETDNGLAFGATMDIDDTDDTTTGTVGDPEVFISGAFGRLDFGSIAIAADKVGLAGVGEAGIGVDSAIEGLRTNSTQADVAYTYSIDGLSVTVSTVIGVAPTAEAAEGDLGLHVGYTMGDLSIGLGYADDHDTGDTAIALGLGYKVGDLALGAMFVSEDKKLATARDQDGYGVSAAYTIDALTLTAVYASVDGATAGAASQDDFGVGFAYNLGGGVTVAGGMGEVNKLDVWDLGIAMKF